MPKPTSKRQRKQKSVNSLRQKGTNQQGSLLQPAPETRAHASATTQSYQANGKADDVDTRETSAHAPEGDSNIECLLPRKRKQGNESAQQAANDVWLSKAHKRKLRRIEEERLARQRRSEALRMLSSHALDEQTAALLRSSAKVGQTDTRREALRRDLQLQRAGVALPKSSRLLHERTADAQHDRQQCAEDPSSSDEEHQGGQKGPRQKGTLTGPSLQPGTPLRTAVPRTEPSGDAESAGATDQQQLTAATSGRQVASAPSEPADNGTANAQEERRRIVAEAAATKQELRKQGLIQDNDSEDDEGAPVPSPDTAAAGAAGPQPSVRVVHFTRPPDVQAVRLELPIAGMEQEIMEALSAQDVVVLAGATGCGKTTQVPQFLLEAGYGCPEYPERSGMVGVTQPRRVAAVSTCKRVAQELGVTVGELVGYQIRYDQSVGKHTRLKFMTDGILMRELQEDFLLRKYSVLLLDEAHERSLNTDLLIGLLSRVVPLRRSMYQEALRTGASGLTKGTGTPSPLMLDTGSDVNVVYPLKLIIMSATLRSEDFLSNARLFPRAPPMLEVPTRQFPVTVHFSRRTELKDYMNAAYSKVCSIHRRLPPGGVLVFVTGQREVTYLVDKLRKSLTPKRQVGALPSDTAALGSRTQAGTQACKPDGKAGNKQRGAAKHGTAGGTAADMTAADDSSTMLEGNAFGEEAMELQQAVEDRVAAGMGHGAGSTSAVDDHDSGSEDFEPGDAMVTEEELLESGSDEEEVVVLGGEDMTEAEIKAAEAKFEQQLAAASAGTGQPLEGQPPSTSQEGALAAMSVHVLPLYALLPPEGQAQVFQPPPPNTRLIIVATNVAETSLTIPGIRYVVDAGRSKQKLLGPQGGALSSYEVRWISKASAEQRAGRAGRTGPGHCYRLYSSAHYNDTFPQHTPPEILNTPLESVVLALKSMGVDKVVNFPFPTAPPAVALAAALNCLKALAALHPSSSVILPLGQQMAHLPISPRHARMLVQIAADTSKLAGKAYAWAVALAAAMSVEAPLLQSNSGFESHDSGNDGGRKAAAKAHARFQSQDGDGLTLLAMLAAYESAKNKLDFCRRNYLHPRLMSEMAALHKQLATILSRMPQGPGYTDGRMQRQKLAACYPLPLQPGSMAGAVTLNGVPTPQEGRTAMDHGPTGSTGTVTAAVIARQQQSPVLPPNISLVLRKAMTAGWVDRVARRVRSVEYVAQQGSKRRAVRYECCTMEDYLYLHPTSPLARTAPEYVVFTEVLATEKRPYMRGVTVIDPAWIEQIAPHMVTYTDPLEHPAPRYNPRTDAICCYVGVRTVQVSTPGSTGSTEASKGPCRDPWELPPVVRPIPAQLPKASLLPSAAAVFGAALLRGEVLSTWKQLLPEQLLAATPHSMCSGSGLAQARVVELVHALQSKKVFSARALQQQWQRDPLFLRRELLLWVRKDRQKDVMALWPKLSAMVG